MSRFLYRTRNPYECRLLGRAGDKLDPHGVPNSQGSRDRGIIYFSRFGTHHQRQQSSTGVNVTARAMTLNVTREEEEATTYV
jgi:hypothetical protein